MTLIGLTGGIATGKSLVEDELRDLGAAVIDADQAYHLLLQSDPDMIDEIGKAFGPEVILGGQVDREKLGQKVFKDRSLLAILNGITHPRVIAAIQRDLDRYREAGEPVVYLSVPLLFEVGMDAMVDAVWVVSCRPEQQLDRLMRRAGIGEEEARRRVAAQMPLREKEARAALVIDNSGEPGETRARIRELHALAVS